MLLVIDLSWKKVSVRQAMYSVAGILQNANSIDRAIVVFPDTSEEKKSMISFVRSLKNGGIDDIRLVVRTSTFIQSDLELISLTDEKEFVLLEDDLTFHAVNSDTIGVRLWLTLFAGGDNQQRVRKWSGYIRNLAGAEPAPFFARPVTDIKWLMSSLCQSHGECDKSNSTIIISDKMSRLTDESAIMSCALWTGLRSFMNVVPITICCGNAESSVVWNLRPFLKDNYIKSHSQIGTRDYIGSNLAVLDSQKIQQAISDLKKRVFENSKNF